MSKSNQTIHTFIANKVIVDFYVFSHLIENWIGTDMNSRLAVILFFH